MASNPVALAVPANAKCSINAISNADWYQRLTLSWSGNSVIFQGSGEGVQMVMPNGDKEIELAPSPTGYQISAFFEYSPNGAGGPFSASSVQNPIITVGGTFTITQVTSEDSSDNDSNDTYLTIVAAALAAAGAETQSAKIVAAGAGSGSASKDETFGTQLELHAKSYYDNPTVQGGDEHYIIIPRFTGMFTNPSYSGQSWSLYSSSCFNQSTPFGGYLHTSIVLNNCQHLGMHERVLQLFSKISYWGSMPTGPRNANWTFVVGGSGQYTVTSVTE